MRAQQARLARRRERVLQAAALAITALAGAAHAATLPPPPVSPVPVTDYEYDAKGNLTKVIKGKGVTGFGLTTQNAYDPLDRLKTSTNAKNGVTSLGYDGQDNLNQVTDPRSLVTQYQRTGLGDVTQLNSPDTGIANSTYDAAGNLLTRTDSRGVLATYTYDVLNRPSSVSYTQAGQATVGYGWTYDQSGGEFGYGVGRLTTATFPAGNTQSGYDAHGRVITSVQTVGTVALTTLYTYDGAGHVTSLTYPSGRKLDFTWQGGQLTYIGLTQASTPITAPLLSNIQWQAFGPARSWQMEMANGPQAYERVFDQYGRLVRYPLNSVVRDLTYDAANRITSYSHLDAATGLATAATQALGQSFGYDELGRLTTVSTASQSWSISYDANGNRTNVTVNGSSRGYAVSATSNRLEQITNPVRSFGYDAAGNTTADSSLYATATYATDNRLTAITTAGATTTYAYDAGGQRVRKTAASAAASRLYAYDQSGHLLGEYDANGTPVQEFVWLGDIPVAVLDGAALAPQILYVYADHLGAPRILVDTTGAERWRWISEPFGSTAADPAPSGLAALEYNLRFPGQYFDKETGLNYNYFRDYDATTGRYVQSDPIGLSAGSFSTYTYVSSAPLAFIDPTGLKKIILLPLDDPNYPAAQNTPDDPTICLVISHGNPNVVRGMDAKKLNKELARQGCTPKQPVVLDACRTGEGENSIAEQLAKLRRGVVRAPDDRTWTSEGGMSNPIPMPPLSSDQSSVLNRVPNVFSPGSWREFGPKGPINYPQPNFQPGY
ncbi:RHS repeat-associated core domain-containing protein [Roseateles sp. YR242]|uniref:RHS repeat domain-containing protein n=1 Tax=Roseateles sp. YR242 TaxID=1855305 RepID=UPI0008CD04AC|nr:RHS repeat-associated core domain-containing protein [Roseateles sp. YR242]SEK50576.1 RHS repeat-associated core domain-containing protein [Roseateles sp. YR242]